LANVGARGRYALTLLGGAVTITESPAKLALQRGNDVVVSGTYADRYLQHEHMEEMGTIGVVGTDEEITALTPTKR
jgi:hypothetical protein